MNIKQTKLSLALTGALFLSLPMSQTFAHEKHCDIKETQLGETMKHMKSELRAYVKGFKKDDQQKMQKHLNELLMLSEKANQYTPAKITHMSNSDKKEMPEMEHSTMDHSKMDHGEMDMDSMDHDMSAMPSMEGMTAEQHHQHMKYMQGMTQLQDLFKQLDETKDKDEIKAILGEIKEHSRKGHQQFRQDC